MSKEIYVVEGRAVWSRPVRENGKVTPSFKVADCATNAVAVLIAHLLNKDVGTNT